MGACGDLSTLQITVGEGNASFTLPTDSMCTNNSPLQLSGTPAGGSWSGNGVNSNGVFDPSTAGAGTHSISYSITGSCPDSYSQSIVVQESVNASIGYVGALCTTGSSVPLIGTPSGGSWSGTGVNANGIFDPFIAGVGSHTINYMVDGLCGDETSTTIVVDDCSSITENQIGSIDIIPNPNNGVFNIAIASTGVKDFPLEIYNQIGKLVYKKDITINSNKQVIAIDLSNLADGVYFISASNKTRKFIKL